MGVPARQAGWMSRHGERLSFSDALNGDAACPATGEQYLLRDGVCTLATEATP